MSRSAIHPRVLTRAAAALLALGPACGSDDDRAPVTPMLAVRTALVFEANDELPCIPPADRGRLSNVCNANLSMKIQTPTLEVELEPFEIDVHEVTTAQYRDCVDAGACAPNPVGFDADMPIVAVTHREAATYCAFVGKRLPTSLEWERVARGPDAANGGRATPTDAAADTERACLLPDVAVGMCDGAFGPVSAVRPPSDTVGESSASVGGEVMGLLGNVAEWTADAFDYYYTCKSPAPCRPRWECESNDIDCLHAAASCDACTPDAVCFYMCPGDWMMASVVCRGYDHDELPVAGELVARLYADDDSDYVVRGASFATTAKSRGGICELETRWRRAVAGNERQLDVGFRCARSLATP